MLTEHTQVALLRSLPKLGLESGDAGVIVHVHGQGEAYGVEFLGSDGKTVRVATVQSENLRQVPLPGTC